MSRSLKLLAGLALPLAVLAGCAGTPATTPAGTPAVTLRISAVGSNFDRDQLSVPAEAPFAVNFNNLDAIPHNVSIRGGSVARIGDIFSGPAERTYVFAGLPSGSYTFICDVHPEMRGTLESTASATAR